MEFDPEDPDLRPVPKFTVEECREKSTTYSAPIFVRAQFLNANTGEIKEQTVFMGDFPMMTERGTFIINGTERVVVSQLVRSPGVIFQPGKDAKTIFTGTIHPYRGEWLEVDIEAKPSKDVQRRRARRAQAPPLALHAAARPRPDVRRRVLRRSSSTHFDFLEPQWAKEQPLVPTQDAALLEIYKRARPGEVQTVEAARQYFEGAFFSDKRYDLTRVGRYKLDRKLGPEIDKIEALFGVPLERPGADQGTLARAEVLATATYLLHLAKHMSDAESTYRIDDQDHFANRRIRSVGELIQNQIRVGLSRMERVVRERMSTQDVEAITPQSLINIRPVVAGGQGVLRDQPAQPVHGPEQPAVGPHPQASPVGARAGRPLAASAPASRSETCTPATTAACARSRRPRARTSASSATSPPTRGSTSTASSRRPYRMVTNGRSPTRSSSTPPTRRRPTSSRRPTRPSTSNGKIRVDRVLVRRGPLGTGIRVGAANTSFGTTSEIDYVPASEVELMDVSPKQIISVVDRAHPVRRARRRQPRAHGREHAEAGRAARRARGALRGHRHRGARRARRR